MTTMTAVDANPEPQVPGLVKERLPNRQFAVQLIGDDDLPGATVRARLSGKMRMHYVAQVRLGQRVLVELEGAAFHPDGRYIQSARAAKIIGLLEEP